jgi:hypothetical protein
MTERHKFEDFFDIDTAIEPYNITPMRAEFLETIKQDFEIFVNDTDMGKNFVLQLIEARDGTDEKQGIGKISVVEHTEDTERLMTGIQNNTKTPSAFSFADLIFNNQTYHMISFPSNLLDMDIEDVPKHEISTDGKSYNSRVGIETFFHELKHTIDIGYSRINRERGDIGFSQLDEYDAISFAAEAILAVEHVKAEVEQREVDIVLRDPFLYGFEKHIADGTIPYEPTHHELRTAVAHEILSERGLDREARLLLRDTPEAKLPYTLGPRKQNFREIVEEKQHNTTINGNPVKWEEDPQKPSTKITQWTLDPEKTNQPDTSRTKLR